VLGALDVDLEDDWAGYLRAHPLREA